MLDLVSRGYTPGQLADAVAYHLPLPVERKQTYLETLPVLKRLHMIIEDINREIEIVRLEEKIEQEIREAIYVRIIPLSLEALGTIS